MIEHRVGALDVKLATRGAPGDLAAHARTFAERLVEAVAERLEERARGKLVLVRRLPVRIRARRELLSDRGELDRLADELAASITWRVDAPSWTDDVIVFDDHAAWHAAFLGELVRTREVAWCFAALVAHPDRFGGLTTVPDATLASILAALARDGALDALLERMGPDVLATIAARLGLAVSPSVDDALSLDHPRLTRAIRAHAGHATTLTTTATATVIATHAAAAASATEPLTTTAAVHLTAYGGLVYLVHCLLELDAGEILWRACVPEPQVIATALAHTIDAAHDDAGPALLGGAPPTDCFTASPAQRAEIVEALCASLHAALPRRGLAAPIAATLRIIEITRGRILCAFAADHLIFAAPAPAATDEHGARAAFLRAWPTGAVDAASDHAASLHLRADLAVDAALIAAVTAGCAQSLLRARTGELELAARARICDDGDVRIVTMPLEAIRIAIRKAGIDRDPGWVPWLERHVRIVFDENS